MFAVSRRKRLVLTHLLDAVVTAGTAGLVVGLAYPLLVRLGSPVSERLAKLGWAGVCMLLILLPLPLAFARPKHVVSTVRGMCRLPRHFGLIPKVLLASVVAVLLAGALSPETEAVRLFVEAGVAVLCLAVGIAVAHGLGMLRSRASACPRSFHDDAPIENEEENQYPAHWKMAGRILTRLLSPSSPAEGQPPSLAIIGPYGSGKTSVCNLVRDQYLRRRTQGKASPTFASAGTKRGSTSRPKAL